MTTWTKETDSSTEYGSGNVDFLMLSEDGVTMATEDEEYIVSEGPSTGYTEEADGDEQWAPFGGLLYLATEGGDILANQNEETYLVVSKGLGGTTFTEVDDEPTSWTKVIDA